MWRSPRQRKKRETLTHTIHTESDLITVRQKLSLREFGRHRQITLLLPQLEPTSRSNYEQSLNRLLRECGCSWGAAFAFVTLGAVVAIRVVNSPGVSVSYIVGSVLLAMALMVPAAGLGKLLGILHARRRFGRTCLELQNAIHHVHM